MHPDEALVQQIIQGNDDAYDGLVQKYQNRIYTIAYRYTGNHADACDLTQETFIKVYQALGSFRGESAFATWLYRLSLIHI